MAAIFALGPLRHKILHGGDAREFKNENER